MTKLTDAINQYFIDMIRDPEVRNSMEDRLKLDEWERNEQPFPQTRNISDAFYVVMGCRFQDAPTKTLFLALIFILAISLTLANFISALFH